MKATTPHCIDTKFATNKPCHPLLRIYQQLSFVLKIRLKLFDVRHKVLRGSPWLSTSASSSFFPKT